MRVILNKFCKIFPRRFFIFLIFISNFATINQVFSSIDLNNNEQFSSKVIFDENENINSDYYILDSGDVIFINFLGAPFLSNTVTINQEGVINLPELNKLLVSGYTIRELEKYLTDQYKEIIFDPEINISIIKYRPVEVFVKGEVKRPGLYNFASTESGLNLSSFSFEIENKIPLTETNPNTDFKKITLYDVLQKANGVTNYADLTKVEVIRKNSNSQGGGKIKTEINLLSLLIEGNQDSNIRIYDGDLIIANRGERMIKEQILSINKSNLSPSIITVFITGNVVQPGAFELLQGSSLTQAIASTGGKKLMTGKIEFIRFNDDGTNIRKTFSYDPNAPINSERNPILMTGDIVNVNKTTFGNATEVITEVSSPILGIFGIYKILAD